MSLGARHAQRHKNRRIRVVYLVSIVLLAIALASCAGTSAVLMPERERGYAAGDRAAEGLVFVPRGAYVVGRDAQKIPVGAWLRVLPGASWPDGIPKPTLIVGRIASQESSGARVEILASRHTIRDTTPIIEVYSGNASSTDAGFGKDGSLGQLHAIPKRLVYPLTRVSDADDAVATGLSASDWTDGGEIYGIISPGTDAKTRLASHMTGLGVISESPPGREEMAIERVAGSWLPSEKTFVSPQTQDAVAFVFLDAPDLPVYGVRISLYGAKLSVLKSENESLLTERLPGRSHIRLDWQDSDVPETSIPDMSRSETDMLEIRVFEADSHISSYDQGGRVSRMPYRAVLENMPPADDGVAAGIVMQALSMTGYWASAVYIGENAWNNADISVKAALAPALADAYRAIGRPDWALEIGLELAGYAKQASGKILYEIMAAQAVVMSICRRGEEFSSVYEAVYRHIDALSPPWQRLFRFALLAHGDRSHDAMLHTLLRRRDTRSGGNMSPLNEIEDWHVCLNAFMREPGIFESGLPERVPAAGYAGWSDYCEDKGQKAQLPLYGASFGALSLMEAIRDSRQAVGVTRDDPADRVRMEEMIALSSQIDALGYPDLLSVLWREIALSVPGDEAILSAWQNAAEYARLSQQKRLYLQMMSELARWMRQKRMNLTGQIFGRAMAGWRALDMREPLGEMLVSRAQISAPAMAAELLKMAADLFLSAGDWANYGAVRALEKADAQKGASP